MVIMFLLWEMDTTNSPVCLATLSAVLCLIPVSEEGIDASGINCVLANNIFLQSLLIIIAPSILASS